MFLQFDPHPVSRLRQHRILFRFVFHSFVILIDIDLCARSQYLALADQAALRIIEYARGTSGLVFLCSIL